MFKRNSIKLKLLFLSVFIIMPFITLRIIYILHLHKNMWISTFGVSKNDIAIMHHLIMRDELVAYSCILLILILMVFLFFRCFLKPIKMMRDTAKKIMDGDFSARTMIVGDDEIGLTAEAFDKMAESIETWGKNSAGVIASISHEIKTPLNVIFSSVQLMDSYKNTLECQEYKNKVPVQLNIIRQNCFRLMRLTNNILDICRHDSGYLIAKLSNNNIVELAEEITLSVKKYAESKGIELVFETDLREKIIACDPDMIERILLNLISNAIKFTNKNGVIKVILTDIDDYILLSVKDSGIGISKDRMNSIFEKFNKDENLLHNKEGTGVGLSLVKAFVEAHEGKIQVKSELNVGSEFTVFLPSKILNQSEYPVVSENQSKYKYSASSSYNGVQRVNIEFSDIYSGYEKSYPD